MKMFKYSSILLFLLNTQLLFSQVSTPDPANYTKLVEVLQPSPNAASLGKYGGINLNFSSGSLNLNLPLLTYKSVDLELPISLFYNSSSIRVNEIAPATGMSWALSAGGVITRSVYGMPDERAHRLAAPADFPARSVSLINFLDNINLPADDNAYWDGQPDLFSFNFNGYSGRFILDSSLSVPILLTYSGIKIESQLTNTTGPWNFKIITNDGIQYYFGGTSGVEKSSSRPVGTGTGRTISRAVPTAFYLTKIVHPNKDSIIINYTTYLSIYAASVNQSMIFPRAVTYTNDCRAETQAPVIPNTSPESYSEVTTSGLLIHDITAASGAKLLFNYSARKDISDQSLLSGIEWYQPGSATYFKKILLDYLYSYNNQTMYQNNYVLNDTGSFYRPFLNSITEKSYDNRSQTHQLYYNDINSLPPRLSFAQDHYGYFNGKANNTLIPAPASNSLALMFPQATANREIDSNFCFKGLLTKIVYPTGGYDSIDYEPNYAYGSFPVELPVISRYLSSESHTRYGPAPTNDTIVIQTPQDVLFKVNCYYSGDPSKDDPLHNLATPSITAVSGDATAAEPFDNVKEGETSQFIYNLTPGTYIIGLKASGIDVSSSMTYKYQQGTQTYNYENRAVGGNRVKKITSKAVTNGIATVKRYFYGTLANNFNSSAILIDLPRYGKLLYLFAPCVTFGAGPEGYGFESLYSSTQIPLDAFGTSPVSYRAVTESNGEYFEDGGTEHLFTATPDVFGPNLLGNVNLSVPKTSYSWSNGKEIQTTVFKRSNSGEIIPVTKTFIHYAEDLRVNSMTNTYLVNKLFNPLRYTDPPNDKELSAYELYMYSHPQKWLYPDTIRTTAYDPLGHEATNDTTITIYNSTLHALPSVVKKNTSKGETQMIENLYAPDINLSGAPELARQSLVSNHIFAPVLKQMLFKNNTLRMVLRTEYLNFSNGLTLPQSNWVQQGNNPIEKRIEFLNYSGLGKLLEEQKTADIKEVYLWGYNNQYPVVKLLGSDLSTVLSIPSLDTSLLNSGTDAQRQAQFNIIRSYFSSNPKVQVSTYTYAPLIGMTSETDPAGRTTYYEYDGFGRLSVVKDDTGKVLRKICYNYAGQEVNCNN